MKRPDNEITLLLSYYEQSNHSGEREISAFINFSAKEISNFISFVLPYGEYENIDISHVNYCYSDSIVLIDNQSFRVDFRLKDVKNAIKRKIISRMDLKEAHPMLDI